MLFFGTFKAKLTVLPQRNANFALGVMAVPHEIGTFETLDLKENPTNTTFQLPRLRITKNKICTLFLLLLLFFLVVVVVVVLLLLLLVFALVVVDVDVDFHHSHDFRKHLFAVDARCKSFWSWKGKLRRCRRWFVVKLKPCSAMCNARFEVLFVLLVGEMFKYLCNFFHSKRMSSDQVRQVLILQFFFFRSCEASVPPFPVCRPSIRKRPWKMGWCSSAVSNFLGAGAEVNA